FSSRREHAVAYGRTARRADAVRGKKSARRLLTQGRATGTSRDHGSDRKWQEHDLAADSGDAPAQCRLGFFQAIRNHPAEAAQASADTAAHRHGLSVFGAAELA